MEKQKLLKIVSTCIVLILILYFISNRSKKNPESLDKKELQIQINRVFDDIDIDMYSNVYIDKESKGEYTIIKALNFDIEKIEVSSLSFNGDELIKDETIETIYDIKALEEVFFDIYYVEGIPLRKLEIYKDGEVLTDYIFSEDGKNGPKEEVILYFSNK